MIGLDIDGIDKLLHKTIEMCDIDIRRNIYENIVLSGGSSCFPGLTERLDNEICKLTSHYMNLHVKIIAPKDRMFSVWNGGATLAELSTFNTMWITKAEYDEVGSAIVNRKCY